MHQLVILVRRVRAAVIGTGFVMTRNVMALSLLQWGLAILKCCI